MKYFAISALMVAGLFVGSSHAQVPASGLNTQWGIEVGAGFSGVGANAAPDQCGCFVMYGGNAQVAVVAPKGLALLADYARTSANNINGGSGNLTLSTYMGGVRYYPRMQKSFSPYVQMMGGVGSTTSNTAADVATNQLAAAVGGGVNIAFSHRFDLRLLEAEYLLTKFPNTSNGTQNQIRVSSGLVYRFKL